MVRSLLFSIAIAASCIGCMPHAPVASVDARLPTVVVKVESISCEGCCATIKEEIAALPGVKSVEADPESKLVQIQVADTTFDSKMVLDRLNEIKYEGCSVVKDVKN
jgi:copper chaperone CopZ